MTEKGFVSKIKAIFTSRPFIIIKKVLWGIVLTIFGALVALVAWLAIDKFILQSPVPSAFGYATLIVDTGSMESELMIGDMILIKKTDDYKIGDIITYLHEGDTIPTTHRIINYTDDGFVTKGDNNNTKDTEDVTPDIIIGEVIHVFPKVGVFATWVQEEGWLYIVACLAIIALGSFIVKPEENQAEENQENNEENNEPKDENIDANTPAATAEEQENANQETNNDNTENTDK